MGGFSLIHWLIVGIIVLLLFGRGRFSDMMGDVAKGLKSFKKGLADEDEAPKPQSRIDALPPQDQPIERTIEAERTPAPEERRKD